MLEGIVICWATAVGLGCWVRIEGVGIRTFLGWIALPVLLFVLGDLLGFGLRSAAWIVVGLSILGLAHGSFKVVGKGLRTLSPAAILNPVFVVPSIALGALALGGSGSYVPLHWDEFTMWLLWPKLQFLADQVWTDAMDISHPGYPPGWPLMLVFPQLFAEQFSEGRSIGAVVVLSAALFGLLFDTALKVYRRPPRRVLWVLGLLLWVPLIPAIHQIIPSEVLFEIVPTKLLVEPAQVALNLGVLALMLAWVGAPAHSRESRWLAGGIGMALAVGYFVKSAMVLFVPLTGLAVFWHLARRERGVGRVHEAAIILALALGPFVVLFAAWHLVAPESPNCSDNPLIFLRSLLGIGEISISLGRFTGESVTFLKNFINLFSGALIAISIAGLASRRFRIVSMLALSWVPIYLGVLYLSYLGCFGGYEQQILTSLERYESVAFITVMLLGALIGAASFSEHSGKLFPTPGKGLVQVGRTLGFVLVVTAVMALFADAVIRFDKMSDRFTAPTMARQFGVAIQTGRKIREIANQRFAARPRVRAITQGSDGREWTVLRYMRVPETRGETMYLYDVEKPYSWSPTSKNPFAQQAGTKEMIRSATDGDIIWPYRLDPWVGQAVNKMTSNPQCRSQPWAFLLVRRQNPTEGQDPFECVINDFILERR
jgi:hypothetical protein